MTELRIFKGPERRPCEGSPGGPEDRNGRSPGSTAECLLKILDDPDPSRGTGPLQEFLELFEEVGARTLGLTLQHHPCLLRGTPALGLIAGQAAADQILPGGGPALAERHHMIHSG